METIVNQTEAVAIEDKANSMEGDVVTEILDPYPCSDAQSEITQSIRTKLKKKRRSLDMAGTNTGLIWTAAGHKRSTRRRFRPLETWRREKLVYGRVHNSLATVVGIKKRSPDARPYAFTVTSFMPAEYDEYVRLAAT
ncbi:hypothetical protein R1sor_002289 [Riccia sorocarpa]|uniref:Uncharacterized protein n=1 Tax=Riccia sorocarpa TaxID=122646 RepID=A0ABD3H0Z1_9MARC